MENIKKKIDKEKAKKEKDKLKEELKAQNQAKIDKLKVDMSKPKESNIKHNYKRLSPSVKAILIIMVGLILSLFASSMIIKDIQDPKQIFGIQIWLSNLQFWNGRLFSNHDGINWTNNWGLLSASLFYLFIAIAGWYCTINVYGSTRMEDTLYRLIWANRDSNNMHAEVIEWFKDSDLYKELCNGKIGKIRKRHIDKILYNEIERLYKLWVYPIEEILVIDQGIKDIGSEFPYPDNEE